MNITSAASRSSSGGATAGEFIESAEVHGNYYANVAALDRAASPHRHRRLLEIDWQGARQVKAQFPQTVGIFILPPSIEALEARLKKRGQDSPAVIARRLSAGAAKSSTHPSSISS